MTERRCQHCGNDISHRNHRTRYCDSLCRTHYHNEAHVARARAGAILLPKRPCRWCKQLFQPRWDAHLFCDRECQRSHQWASSEELPAWMDTHTRIEHDYQQALKAIKAERRRLDEDMAWSQPSSWHEHVNKNTPDTTGLWLDPARARKPERTIRRTNGSEG